MASATPMASVTATSPAPPEDISRIVRWSRPPTYGAPPPARGGHTANMVGNLMVVFGGTRYESANKFQYMRDTWALDTDTMKWHAPACAGGRTPGARYGHSAVVYDYKLYVFGGKGEGGILYNDLWCLDVEHWRWSHIPAASAAPPSARLGQSMTAIGDKLAVWGGWDGKTCNNDFWLFDVKTAAWVRPPVSGIVPAARHGHSAVYDESSTSLVFFGGWVNAADGVPQYQKDVRALELRSLSWARPRVMGDSPGPRYWHAVAPVGNVMVVSGGYDGPRQSWGAKTGGAVSACSEGGGGAAAAASADAAGSELPSTLLAIPYVSGMGGDALAGPGSTISVPYGPHRDTYFFDCESCEWVQPSIAGTAPGYRYGHSAAAAGATVLLFGGWEGGRAMNDCLVLDLSGLVSGGDADDDGAAADAGGGGDEVYRDAEDDQTA